jgi:hypothetical protein
MEIIVTYVLPPRERPTNPGRLWHGLILGVQPWGVHVRSLDEGYEGLEEFVVSPYIVSYHGISIDSPSAGWYTLYVG